MFARTPRLTLRPAWAEDAPAFAAAIAHEAVATRLASVPWPYPPEDAVERLGRVPAPGEAMRLILAHDLAPAPTLVGAIGIGACDEGFELGYWLTPSAWGRGYAVEAGQAMLGMARYALGHRQLSASHALDNPASRAVLDRLGFVATGRVVLRDMRALGTAIPTVQCVIDLTDATDAPVRLAA